MKYLWDALVYTHLTVRLFLSIFIGFMNRLGFLLIYKLRSTATVCGCRQRHRIRTCQRQGPYYQSQYNTQAELHICIKSLHIPWQQCGRTQVDAAHSRFVSQLRDMSLGNLLLLAFVPVRDVTSFLKVACCRHNPGKRSVWRENFRQSLPFLAYPV